MLKLFVIVAVSASAFSYKVPEKPKCTGPNEYYTLTKASCPPEVCFQIVAFFDCYDAEPDAPGCRCEDGYLRMNLTSPCINTCKCPERINASECLNKD